MRRIAPLLLATLAACGDASGGAQAASKPDLTVDIGGGVTMDFVLVRPGTFTMGEHSLDASFVHQVKIAKSFFLGRYEVTQEQWKAVMGTNPSRRKRDRLPIDVLTWNDCERFVSKLNSSAEGPKYFIPSEAQWEYACRAGSSSKWCFGDDPAQLGEYAWFRSNCGGRQDAANPAVLYDGSSHPVGLKKPNIWGFYDMHGNASEWCADTWHSDLRGAPTDGTAWVSMPATARVSRGGAYASEADHLRCATRGYGAVGGPQNVFGGLRIAREAEAQIGTDTPNAEAAVDAAAEARAMQILETYRDARSAHYPDPREAELVAVGRPAVGALVRVLSEKRFDEQWGMQTAAKRVLPHLVLDEDAPTLERLMREGHRGLETAFGGLYAPASITTLAGLLRDGCFDTGLHEAARPHLRDPAIVEACCAWLANPRYEGDTDFAIAKMAELVGGTGPYRLFHRPSPEKGTHVSKGQPLPEIVPEAAPALRGLLERPLRVDARQHVAAALVRIGDRAGIPVLIEILGTSGETIGARPSTYHRHAAGLLLNAVSHTAFYWTPAYDERSGEILREDQFSQAAGAFAEWWRRAERDLRFDPATQSWSIK